MCCWYLNVTDGRTDGQLTVASPRSALASRGKNGTHSVHIICNDDDDDGVCCIVYSGGWSSEGCELVSVSDSRVTCSCNHLTNFAVLLSISPAVSRTVLVSLSFSDQELIPYRYPSCSSYGGDRLWKKADAGSVVSSSDAIRQDCSISKYASIRRSWIFRFDVTFQDGGHVVISRRKVPPSAEYTCSVGPLHPPATR